MKKVNVIDIVKIQEISLEPERLSTSQLVGAMLPVLQLVVLTMLLIRKADKFIEKSKKYQAKLMLCQLMYFTEKYIKNNDPAVRQIATEAAESNAPPTAPPDYNASPAFATPQNYYKIKETIEVFYDSAIAEIDSNIINNIFLADQDIKKYILEKLIQKCINYPHFLNLNFTTQADFNRFNKNLTGEIYRLFLNLFRTGGGGKKEPVIVNARKALRDLCGKYIFSSNTIVSQDGGKGTEILELLDPAEMLPLRTDADDLLLDAALDAPSLFVLPPATDKSECRCINIKPPRRRTGRAARIRSQQSFDFICVQGREVKNV